MPGSTVSLESLSSPSPSPPPPEQHRDHEQHSNHSGAGLDSGSELSELTEEEQDNDGANEDESSRSAARKKKQRDRVVPPPMWDWAVKKKGDKKDRPDWRPKFEEEEEEEEQAGPAEAMEEEEDDDQARDLGSDPVLTPDHEEGALSGNEVDDNEHEEEPPEDEGESADEAPPPMEGDIANGDVSGDEVDEVDDPENADLDPDPLDDHQSPKPVASPDLTDDEIDNEHENDENVGEDEVEDDDVPDTGEVTKEGSEVDEEEEGTPADGVEIPADDEPPTTEAVTPAEAIADAVDADLDAIMDVDPVQPVLMSPVAVAASSIMAGASLLVSPSSSQPSTPSGSRHSSRYPSVEPEPEQDVPSEPEVEPEPERKPSGRTARIRKGKGRTRAARRSRAAAAAEAGEVDLDGQHAELPDGEGVDGEDLDVATPELDLDADMQPAHRAEALDVLAGIELKFALLRERLYVEKMDSLAWEEGLIADGTHPELLHLQAELSSRRDKRLELAARRRDYEAANVAKRRRLDESGAWSTWSNDRDRLQSQMIAETNGKKRKLERERRTLERPQPVRRYPLPLHDVPPAPSLRDIVKSSPFGLPESTSALAKRVSRKKESASQMPLAYPTLAPLSRGEIMHDFDLFHSHRHVPVGYDPHRGMPGLMNAVLGGVPNGMDPYAMGMPIMDGPNRFGPPIQHQLMQGFAPPPRLPHQLSAPPGAPPHISHHQLQMEQEMQMRQIPGIPHPHMQQFAGGPASGPGILMRRSISPVPLNGVRPGSSVPTTLGGGPIPPGFSNSKANGWTGPGRDSKRLNGDGEGRDRERTADVLSQREKERIERERALRDLDRDREQEAERAYRMSSHVPSRHSAHQHSHPHVHSNAQASTAHHHGPHNHQHQHHHHHVHHHHHGPPNQGFPGPGGGHAPPMAGLPPNAGAGSAVQTRSPGGGRDFEQRRPRSGAPTEAELPVSLQKQPANSPPMSAFWKGEPLPLGPMLPSDRDRERERDRERAPPGPLGPPPPDVHDRLMTPFAMGPSQIQREPPSTGSPRKMPGPVGASNPTQSMPSSRRGSWSADDHPRPSSAALGPAGPGIASGSQRLGGSRLPQPPSTSSYHGSFGSPPNSNGRVLPHPSSPSAFAGPLRSPVRSSQPGRMPLGGPHSPPPGLPLSPRGIGSPGMKHPRAPSPGLPKPLPKLGGFPIPETGNFVLPNGALHPSSSSSGSVTLPPPPTALPPSRISNGALMEKVVAPPSTKAVPVDGS
ncbi:hypothetical protein V8D89_000069 [Ganoderma adspersum]